MQLFLHNALSLAVTTNVSSIVVLINHFLILINASVGDIIKEDSLQNLRARPSILYNLDTKLVPELVLTYLNPSCTRTILTSLEVEYVTICRRLYLKGL